MLYMVTFTINIPPMLAYMPYMDPMGILITISATTIYDTVWLRFTTWLSNGPPMVSSFLSEIPGLSGKKQTNKNS
jgi:hypothetical protein